jgi:hypothetical protein
MTDEKHNIDHAATKNQVVEDNLNAKIGVLTRREVEARILAPMLDAMGEAFGREASPFNSLQSH